MFMNLFLNWFTERSVCRHGTFCPGDMSPSIYQLLSIGVWLSIYPCIDVVLFISYFFDRVQSGIFQFV